MRHTLTTRWTLVIAIVLIAIAPAAASAATMPPVPTPQFRRYGLLEGLPSSKAHAVVQDARGFIWIGTSVGVSRFDGVEFVSPGVGPGKAAPFPTGEIGTLMVDADDRLWMGGPDFGLGRYDPETGEFRHWQDELVCDDVRAIAQARDGTVWVGTGGGLMHLRPDGSGIARHPAGPDGPSGSSIRALHASDDGRVWIGSDAGVDMIDVAGRITPVAFEDGTRPRVVRIDGHAAELRVATDRGLYRLSEGGQLRRDRRLPALAFGASLADSHGSLWLAGPEGLLAFDRYGRLHAVPGSWTTSGGLPGRVVRDILEDREHGLWFALSDGGLAYLGPAWEDFTRFAHVATDPHSFPGRTVTAVAFHGGTQLWVGGLRGWIRAFDPATGRTESGFDVGDLRVQSLLEVPRGLLVGTAEGLYLARKGAARPWLRGVIDRPVTTLVEGPRGTVYAAVFGEGLFAIDPSLRTARPIPFATSRRGDADTRQIEMLGDELWQASLAGLARLDAATGAMTPVDGVAPGRIHAFEPDDGGLWIVRPGSMEHYLWDGRHAVLDRTIGRDEGFPSADILNIRRDVAGRLWLFGHTGVWRYDPGTGAFRPFGLADGLASGEFTNATTVQLDDGTMYGATLGGLVGFRPDRQHDHSLKPAIALLGASVSRDGVRQPLPIDGGRLHLAWNDRELVVAARALSYVNPDRNHLSFALEYRGETTRTRAGKDGMQNFGQLRAGTYRLVISGAGRDEVTGELARPLSIVVDPPPWLSGWAWLAYAIAVVASLVAVVSGARRRVRHTMRLQLAEQQKRLAEEANAAKTEFMATLGHEIRTPMTGVLGMAELIARTPLDETQRAYVEAVRRSGNTLLRLVNDALDITRIEARRLVLESECVSLRAIAEEVVALAAARAREKQLELTSSVHAGVPASVRGDAIRLQQILQNLVNNAVKFTDRGRVSLHIAQVVDGIVITVSDTGPGMSPELSARVFSRFEQGGSPQRGEGTGLGLAICHELCVLMGGTITVASEPGRGSDFIVRLPLVSCDCGACAGVAAESTGSVAGRKLLLVEDDPVVGDVLVGLLRQRGHSVVLETDGLSAMTSLSRDTFDAMLLDLDLPMMDGFQVARMVRRMASHATMPIVAVTARSAGDEAVAIREAGMDALLRKPMTGDDLDAVLESVCATDV
ncbi:Signal transduction histidine kinase [Luteibacter sp. UNC138MFCol5.1]|uniref:hybrid sensor histidine kinase/response regulator n=1 Tax=Luteibacter sp. UNC138MFCol5.1 TaxID=1502774 RepID=UPI0008CA10C4|nr:ATP-binding protein [Luteibacter sp. UNC138MFCol5.1]SEP13993.1 Signal transduction histidine kinase [Luteibacter sp. UNC138MFCol5.1]